MSPELYIAALKLTMMLGAKKFKVLKSDVTSAIELPDKMQNLADRVMNGEEITIKSLSYGDLEDIIEQVKSFSPELVMADSIPELEKEGLGAEFAVKLIEMVNLLITALPATESFSLQAKFLWRARIAENPLIIYDLISKSQLSATDVDTLIAIYPDIYEMLVASLIESSVETYTIDNPIPRRLKLMLSILLKTPVIDVKTLKAYRAAPQPAQADINLGAK